MDSWTIYAWILLAVKPTATSKADLIWRTAALNKAEATDAEIELAVGWLRDAGLIAVTADGLLHTPAGDRLLEEEWDSTSMYETWKRVARRLRTIES